MTECAIVLAAGENRRMGSVEGVSLPKSLLPIRQEDAPSAAALPGSAGEHTSFMSRHLELFRSIGVERTFVVVNPAGLPWFEPFGKDDGVELVVVDTSGEERTGSSVSMLAGLRAALAWRPQGARTLVTDADIVYERGVLDRIVAESAAGAGARLSVVKRVSGDSEEVRVYGLSADQPLLIGKGMTDTMTQGLSLLGESLGLIALDASTAKLAAEITEWIVGDPPERRPYGYSGRLSEHEEVWQYLFTLGLLELTEFPGSLLFSECDFPEDYRAIREGLFPQIARGDELKEKAGPLLL
ncbi:Sden_1164 family protein [Streptomyces acidiscabies]|uniref:Sden_1164 family protein n=1 Tax=Streptomyces acidiscabies TaxID=42234 RepID=UPI00073F3DBE|nr:Sden_1164 family protein [Streptomyces acidiscabies]GAQ51304.1 MobA-like NTP transferase domain protein [Streptomyces acidiscabies]